MDRASALRCAELARCAAAGLPVMVSLLELLDDAVGADSLSVARLRLGDVPQAEVELRGAEPMTAEEMRLWPQLLPTHPYARRLVTGSPTASRSSDSIALRDLQRLTVYDLLLRPRGSVYQAGLVLERSAASMLLVSLWRRDGDFSDAELADLEALRRPMAAGLALHAALAALTTQPGPPAAAVVTTQPGPPAAAVLTVRQRHVVALVAQGMTNEQVGRRLGISARTVRKHLEGAWQRTGTTSRAALAAWWATAA